MLTLIRAGEALATDAIVEPAALGKPEQRPAPAVAVAPFVGPIFTKPPYTARMLSDPLLTAPGGYQLPGVADSKTFSPKDFRPRGRSVFETDPRSAGPEDGLMMDKNMWQRLNEYRNHDRVRVLTLLETGASSISIQTDRKGDPSLQWTSRLMNRGGASHGLLDQLFPTSVFGGTTHVTRSATSQPSRISGALSALHFGNSPP
jgi:hypothetical protein